MARYQLRLNRRNGSTAEKASGPNCFIFSPLKNASGSQISEQTDRQKLSRVLRRLMNASMRSYHPSGTCARRAAISARRPRFPIGSGTAVSTGVPAATVGVPGAEATVGRVGPVGSYTSAPDPGRLPSNNSADARDISDSPIRVAHPAKYTRPSGPRPAEMSAERAGRAEVWSARPGPSTPAVFVGGPHRAGPSPARCGAVRHPAARRRPVSSQRCRSGAEYGPAPGRGRPGSAKPCQQICPRPLPARGRRYTAGTMNGTTTSIDDQIAALGRRCERILSDARCRSCRQASSPSMLCHDERYRGWSVGYAGEQHFSHK